MTNTAKPHATIQAYSQNDGVATPSFPFDLFVAFDPIARHTELNTSPVCSLG